jgi:NTE family protein
MGKVQGVGVAFCGGGFRSFSEVAAIEDMERNGVRIGAVAGTSMGSLVAALVGAGLDSARIEELLVQMDGRIVDEGVLNHMRLKVLNVVAGNNGLIDSKILESFSRDVLAQAGVSTFNDFRMPVALTAVDVISGELCVFTNDAGLFGDTTGNWRCLTGDLDVAKCVAASGSYPLVISSTHYLGRTFMDGGCRMNLPTPLFDRDGVDAVVGVSMVRRMAPTNDLTPLSIARRTMSCGANQLDRIYAQMADIHINLPVSGDDAFQAGTGQQVIAEARQMIAQNPVDWSAARPSALDAVKRKATDVLARMARRQLS